MSIFTFPDVGEGLAEGTIVKWLVKQGDTVTDGQTLAQVSTDKSIVDLPSPHAGTIAALLVPEGTTVRVGQPVVEFGDSQTAGAPSQAPPQVVSTTTAPITKKEPTTSDRQQGSSQVPVNAPSSSQRPSDILAMPKVRHYAKEHGIDLSGVKASGAHGQIIMADVQGNAPSSASSSSTSSSATTAALQANQQQSNSPPPSSATTLSIPTATVDVASSSSSLEILAPPSVRQYARAQGVDITKVKGSGQNGKISKEDIDMFLSGKVPANPPSSVTTQKQATASSAALHASTAPSQSSPTSTSGTVEPITPIRKIIAKRMLQSLQQTAQVTHTDDANVTDLVALRSKEKERLAQEGVKLSYLPFFIKATVSALKTYPHFNGRLNQEQEVYELYDRYDIGIAVDTPQGLLVPVIRNADRKSIKQLAVEIDQLASKARDGKLAPQEMQGSTFTISSVGSLGGKVFTPIINYPEIAILGVGKISDVAGVVDGTIVPIKQITFSLTFDHCAVDGADAAKFLNRIITLLEDPQLLLLEL